MKSRDINQARQRGEAELHVELSKHQARLEELRFDLAQGKVKNIREIRALRRTIAQLRTVMGEAGSSRPGKAGADGAASGGKA